MRKRRRRATSAVWQDDAPYAIAIGVTIAVTAAPLIFPVPWSVKAAVDEKKRFDDFNTMGDEDTKYTAMAVISFLPLFNWLAWVLAWLDSSDPRYALYAAVYLAPWVKSGLNFTDSWLPLGAVALGAAHVQLDRYVQSEGPVRSLPTESEQPAELKEEKALPAGAFDDRGWAANVQEKDLKKLKPLSEEEIRRREEKWELKRWDQQFAERLEAEAAAEEALPQEEER
ncbi:hypothetical protein KFL_000780130 [Klebsormidium nitens]|uniref:Uncharacterized protein n=1 Tax=Klebsormidium nitens TaxID=105231 RepID=A0A1Y1HWJ6_KLENI|nr:hypothetical protein KFL_000780130 [Klebsormidium nitens]|eukprot:GAQ81351.1 hypothetical protein KFL_000780130 [Klebsormidium nitens]